MCPDVAPLCRLQRNFLSTAEAADGPGRKRRPKTFYEAGSSGAAALTPGSSIASTTASAAGTSGATTAGSDATASIAAVSTAGAATGASGVATATVASAAGASTA